MAMALAPAPAASRAPDHPLTAPGEAFVARRLARAPHAAVRGGAHTAEPLTGTVLATALDAELAWLRQFRDRLAAAPRDAPGSGRADERDLLDAAVERDLVELEILRPYRRDPGAYLTLLADGVEAALERSDGSPCVRLQRAARRLAEAPELLRAARINLTDAPRTLIELAIERCAGVLRFCREDVPRLAAGCRSPRMQADLAQADTVAVRAIEAFRRYLEEDLLAASRADLAIGPAACRRLLAAQLAMEVAPVESVLAGLARLVEARGAELDSLARAAAASGEPDPPDSLAAGDPGDGDALARVARGVERVEGFLAGREIVTLRSRPALRPRAARPFRRPTAVALACAGGPGDARRMPAWLEVRMPVTGRPGDGGPAGPARLDDRELDLAVVHEGVPGRVQRALVLRGAPSRLRRALLEGWSGGDWGEYCERMMLDEGYGAEDPRYRVAGAARGLRHAGRALAALALHAGAMSPDEARRMLEERCRLAPGDAAAEVLEAAADPARMGYTIGAQRLRELQDEARRRLGPRYRTRAFNDAVLRCGASPPGFVRERLWRELTEATGDHPVGAKP
jgi:hypothetical protein